MQGNLSGTEAWNDDQDGGEHKARVRRLADELIAEYGIEVLLDQYVLQPGVDADAYMEGIANSNRIDKVIAICEPNYVTKANERKGGVGKEGVIMSPQLYEQLQGGLSVEQRFVAVMFSGDQKPTMFGNSIHINMRDEQEWTDNIETLVRFIYNKPLAVPPPRGSRPAFLDEDPELAVSSGTAAMRGLRHAATAGRTVRPALRDLHSQALTLIRETDALEQYSASAVLTALDTLTPMQITLVEAFKLLSIHETLQIGDWLNLLDGLSQAIEEKSHYSGVYDHVRLFQHELLLHVVAAAIELEQLDFLTALFKHPFMSRRSGQVHLVTFTNMRFNPETFDPAYARESGSRWLSSTAHVLLQRGEQRNVSRALLVEAEVLLILAALLANMQRQGSSAPRIMNWYPTVTIHAEGAGDLPLFQRWISSASIERWGSIYGLGNDYDLAAPVLKSVFQEQLLSFYDRDSSLAYYSQVDRWGSQP
ncbi:SEFIR domain protein (plasmid) [Deinococcus proteolyticus MRP]|uniref:SEFIR domain protein n=1 Tax=Deinococcus proteolyticus (strain ATCC 35074 / DSM 20540 / JCM 6276 / NBRC 101906 / NCIMB 13154 / VKM Ac-1939 / CCM 2703 / MRP) TaxID=693977 RepID=F0RR91_DEIPM|nr:toll/interleukin-1 receptor domain-containing protein [Deinococcus proteolyticus]ADY27800.1 SEFIR domain protein [Deinococcus proteolyticus MRP]